MNRYTALGCLGLGLMVSPLLGRFAVGAVPANPKVGVIDIERTLAETPSGKAANKAFEAIRTQKQQELDKKQQDFKKADLDLEKQQSLLKPDVLKAKKEELEKQYVDLGQLAAKLEKDLATERAKLMQGVLKKAEPLIAEVAKAEGVTIILEQSAIVWADPTVDLTPKLEAKM